MVAPTKWWLPRGDARSSWCFSTYRRRCRRYGLVGDMLKHLHRRPFGAAVVVLHPYLKGAAGALLERRRWPGSVTMPPCTGDPTGKPSRQASVACSQRSLSPTPGPKLLAAAARQAASSAARLSWSWSWFPFHRPMSWAVMPSRNLGYFRGHFGRAKFSKLSAEGFPAPCMQSVAPSRCSFSRRAAHEDRSPACTALAAPRALHNSRRRCDPLVRWPLKSSLRAMGCNASRWEKRVVSPREVTSIPSTTYGNR